jgi:hypothetical protein
MVYRTREEEAADPTLRHVKVGVVSAKEPQCMHRFLQERSRYAS